MADLSKTIEVIFKGVDNTSSALSSIGSNISGFSSSVGSVTGPLASFTGSLLKVEAGIVAIGAAAIGYSVNQAVKFESAFLDFKKVANDVSEKDLPGLITKVEEVGLKYGVAATDVLNAATNFVQAGYNVKDSFDLVEVAATAAVVSELSAAEASDVLIRSLAGFGAGAKDAATILDIFNKVSDSTAVSLPELASGFADLAPIAKTMGLSFEETAAFLVPIIERFGSGSEAANALKTAFSRLVDPTKATREALEQVGISQRDANGEFLTGRPLLEAVQKQFSSLTDEQKLFTAANLVGINQAARFVPILDDQEGYMKALATATSASGSALAEFNIRINSSEIQFQRLGVATDIMAIKIGDKFRPVIGESADSLRGLSDVIGKLVAEGKLDTFFAALTPIFKDFSDTIDNIAENLGGAINQVDFTPIKRALDDLRGAFGGVFDNVDVSTPEGLAKALQQIVNIGAALIDFTRGIIEGFTPFIQAMSDAASGASTMGKDVIAGFGQIAGAATAINAFLPIVAALGAAITALGTGFGALSIIKSLNLVSEITSFGTATDSLLLKLGKAGLVGAAGAAGFALGDFIAETKVGQSIVSGLTDIFSELTGESTKYSDAAAKMLEPTKAFSSVAKDTTRAVEELAKEEKVAGETTEEWANRIAETTKAFLAAGEVYDAATGQTRKQSEVLKEAADSAQDAADKQRGYTKSIIDGVETFTQYGTSASGGFGTAKTSADEAAKASDAVKEKMLELASDERIKRIEFSVRIKTAQIEADTERVKAAFESVNQTIKNTGDVISSALGSLGSIDGFYALEKFEIIEKQLEKENEYRKAALELQKDLTKAQVAELNARADALSNGETLIKIDGSGLEPEIEAFMFKILKKIQVRANAEAGNFLLGI